MEIKLKNFKNIETLELEIEEGKINYIYGSSGSGKSSIGRALSGNISDDVVTYTKELEDLSVTVNPMINPNEYSIFDENTQKQLLINRTESNDMYSIIFAEDNSLEIIRNDINVLLSKINSQRHLLNTYKDNADKILKQINTRKMGKKFSSNSSIEKLKEEIENPKYKDYSNFIKKHGLEYIKWMDVGSKFQLYTENKCPFCTRKLTDSRKEKLKTILEIKPEHYKLIADSQDVLNDIGIEVPNFSHKREVIKLEKELYDANDNTKIIEDMFIMLDSYNYNTLDVNKIEKIKLSNSLKRLFPDLEVIIEEFNNNITQIKKQFGKIKAKTMKIVNNNIKTLDSYLERFSIPYKFEVDNFDTDKQKATVFLVSTKDKKHEDRTNNLSYGEKNIIALILFLVSTNKQFIIIDDPASSYDNNRRKIIYELLYEFHKNRTFIVLSHDQVFLKYAMLGIKDKTEKKYKEKTGKVICLENHIGNCLAKEIKCEDIGLLTNQIKEFIMNNNMSYYRKIINLRLLAECNKSSSKIDKIIYGYLSEILHRNDKEIINNELSKNKKTEAAVLKLIFSKCGIKLCKMPNDILKDFDYNELTNFEKIAYKREEAKLARKTPKGNKAKTTIEKEFDDIVHLNTRYFVSLNPYKFDIFSEHIYKHI